MRLSFFSKRNSPDISYARRTPGAAPNACLRGSRKVPEKALCLSTVELIHLLLPAALDRPTAQQLKMQALDTPLYEVRNSEHEAYLCSLVAAMAQRGADAEQALSVLYDHTARKVAATIGRFLSDRELVAELTQDTFFQAWNQADRFDATRGCVLAWLLIIARSRALDARRRKNAQPVVFDSDVADAMLEVMATSQPSALEVSQANQEQALLQRAILALSPSARHMLALAFFSDLSHSEIAAHMQLPLGTIKSTLRRGLASLASELERSAPGIGKYFGLTTVSIASNAAEASRES